MHSISEPWTLGPGPLFLKFVDRLATQSSYFSLVAQLRECIEGSLDHVVRVCRTERLGQHVLNAAGSHDGANRLAGDDSGTFRGRLQQNRTGAETAEHLMGNRGLGEVDADQVLLRGLNAFTNRLGYLFCLTRSV